MNAPQPFWHINAFTARSEGGNPAGVILLDEWPQDAVLAAKAVAIALPATAFLGPCDQSDDADRAIRWFAPTGEIALCGHASLAAGHVLLGESGDKSVRLTTRPSGVVTVQRCEAGYEVSLPAITTRRAQHNEAAALLGLSAVGCWRSDLGYTVFELESEAQLRALTPDFEGLANLPREQLIATAPGVHTDIASRVFVSGEGAVEDSVTGSAHAVLAPIWAARLDRAKLTAHQASERGGDLTLRLEGDRVWVGGQCVMVARS